MKRARRLLNGAAAHLGAPDAQARERGGRIARVVVGPAIQDDLEPASLDILRSFSFNRREAWVRHDDRYRVDFAQAARILGKSKTSPFKQHTTHR